MMVKTASTYPPRSDFQQMKRLTSPPTYHWVPQFAVPENEPLPPNPDELALLESQGAPYGKTPPSSPSNNILPIHPSTSSSSIGSFLRDLDSFEWDGLDDLSTNVTDDTFDELYDTIVGPTTSVTPPTITAPATIVPTIYNDDIYNELSDTIVGPTTIVAPPTVTPPTTIVPTVYNNDIYGCQDQPTTNKSSITVQHYHHHYHHTL